MQRETNHAVFQELGLAALQQQPVLQRPVLRLQFLRKMVLLAEDAP